MATQINVDTITNATIQKKLGFSSIGECHFDILPTEVLERYFGEYSLSAKGYRTRDIPDPSKLLLQMGCVHINAYGMPKQKVGVVISTFKG